MCLGLQQVQRQLTATDQDTRWLDPRTLGDDGSPEGRLCSGYAPAVEALLLCALLTLHQLGEALTFSVVLWLGPAFVRSSNPSGEPA